MQNVVRKERQMQTRSSVWKRNAAALILAAILVLVLPALAAAQSGEEPTANIPPANQLEAQVEALDARVGPGILNITSSIITQNSQNQSVPGEGTGTGWVFDRQGHIVTNYHVVKGAQFTIVTLANGNAYKADIIGTDPSSDLAVLRINAPDLPPPLELANEDALRVGMFVVALGNPFGLNRTLTFGVISALGRVIQSPDGAFVGEAIQTDAPINPGNSGGPLLDLEGKVVGITSQILSPSGSSAGIGFAIPSNLVGRVVPKLISQGHYEHPYLGIQGTTINPIIAEIFNQQAGVRFPVDSGALVIKVSPGSPAAQAGVRGGTRTITVYGSQVVVGGDIIVAMDGTPIRNFEQLGAFVQSEKQVGDKVSITLYRGNTRMTVQVTLTARP
jgi:S1-C subfamily serine protease